MSKLDNELSTRFKEIGDVVTSLDEKDIG